MKEQKYVVVKQGGLRLPIMFDPILRHSHVARNFAHQVVSAGFVRIYHHKEGVSVSCYGRSESLNVDSQAELDAALFMDTFFAPEF